MGEHEVREARMDQVRAWAVGHRRKIDEQFDDQGRRFGPPEVPEESVLFLVNTESPNKWRGRVGQLRAIYPDVDGGDSYYWLVFPEGLEARFTGSRDLIGVYLPMVDDIGEELLTAVDPNAEAFFKQPAC